MKESKLYGKLRENLIALISVIVAVSALLYSTWRLEVTEHNRNVRIASFEALKTLTELQLFVDYAYYDKNQDEGDPIKGWSYVIYIGDLSEAISPETVQMAEVLHSTRQENWQFISEQSEPQEKVTESILETRLTILEIVNSLD